MRYQFLFLVYLFANVRQNSFIIFFNDLCNNCFWYFKDRILLNYKGLCVLEIIFIHCRSF